MEEQRIAAFFDIDGTLYREGLITEIFKKLVKHEIVDNARWYNEVRPEYLKWERRVGNYDDYLLKMASIYIEAIKGMHKNHIEFIAKKVIEQKGDKVYTFTRDRILWHKSQGHLIITISGSPLELVREMSLKHGFDDFIGTKYFLDENLCYTGKINPMWDSKSKFNAIKNFEEKYNIDLSKSFSYGDTSGDFLMLRAVGNPTVINGTRELLNEIISDEEMISKTKIIIERKDVIYDIKPSCLKFCSLNK